MIRRGPKPEQNYLILKNAISGDQRLNWAARGLLIYLLSKPEGWKVNVQNLVNETSTSAMPIGRDGVYSLIKQLVDVGYMKRIEVRDKGRITGYEYEVFEPLEPDTVEPLPVEPDTANPTYIKDCSLSRTKKNKSNVVFEECWKAFPHAKGRSSKAKSLAIFQNLPTAEQSSLTEAIKIYGGALKDRDREFVPAMERWLRDGKFRDFIPKGTPQSNRDAVIEIFLDSGTWNSGWGKKPTAEEIEDYKKRKGKLS